MYKELNINGLDAFLDKIKTFDFSNSTELIDIQFETCLYLIDEKKANFRASDMYEFKKQSDELIILFRENRNLRDKIIEIIDLGINYTELQRCAIHSFFYCAKSSGFACHVYDAYLLNELFTIFFSMLEVESKKKVSKKTNQ